MRYENAVCVQQFSLEELFFEVQWDDLQPGAYIMLISYCLPMDCLLGVSLIQPCAHRVYRHLRTVCHHLRL